MTIDKTDVSLGLPYFKLSWIVERTALSGVAAFESEKCAESVQGKRITADFHGLSYKTENPETRMKWTFTDYVGLTTGVLRDLCYN